MSKNLRDKLRELCAFKKLPNTIPAAQKRTLKRWCKKLEAADGAGPSTFAEPSSMFGLVAVGLIGFFLWQQQQQVAGGVATTNTAPVFKPMSNEDLAAARVARMKRFDNADTKAD